MPETGYMSRHHLERLRHIYFNNSDSEIQTMALSELLYQSSRPAPDRRPLLEVGMILIQVRNPQGPHAWCDAQCYDADGDACTCCCGGANHGQGLEAALSNIPAIVSNRVPDLWIESRGDELPPGCQAYANLLVWVPASSFADVATIAHALAAARQADPGPELPDAPKNAGTE